MGPAPGPSGGGDADGRDGPPTTTGESADEDGPNWWLRIVIVLAIAIPVLIEGGTLLGLIGSQVTDTPTPTATPENPGVGVGDELLPETTQTDRITGAILDQDGRYTLTVLVENTGSVSYELRLGAVTTDAGTEVEGNATTGTIAPGNQTAVAGRWVLPDGERPATLAVVAVLTRADGSTERVTATVELAPVGRSG